MSRRSNPFDGIEQFFERMSRQLEEASRSLESQAGVGGGTTGIDLADEGDRFVVTVDVPGFDRENVDLRIAEDTLYVNAEREESGEDRSENYLRSERRSRSIRRAVSLPEPVVEDDVHATIRNGVLTVELPKAEGTDRGRSIEIE